ncbi:MAG: DNA-directed RNA polymerase subunit alpha C-terminal domain-containing protein [Phycisphaerae bacterium]|nr:DNA-directed RNA polymerase subunit alpha C-terminal domain-containing protein [Phycisphaerae bacterium]
MVAIIEPQVDLFSEQNITLDNIQATSDFVNSSEQRQIAFAEKTEQALKGSKNYLALGAALAIMGKYAQATEMLEKAPDSKEKYLELAHCLRKTEQYDNALDALDKAAKNGADVLQVNCAKASVYRVTKDFEQAAKALKACENYQKANALYHYTLGRCQQAQGDYEEAIANYTTAVEIDPEFAKAMFHLAFVLDIRGDEVAAMDYYKQLAKSPFAYVSGILNLAVLYEDMGEYGKAINCVERVLKSHPNNQRAILFKKDISSSQTMFYDEEVEKSKSQQNRILETPISDFELSVRSRNCLKKMNINTLGDLLRITEAELLAYKNFGETSLSEIKKMLESKNLHLGMCADGKTNLIFSQESTDAELNVDPEILNKPLSELDMSVRARRCLEQLNMRTIGELASKTEDELLGVKNFGATSLTEMRQILESVGLSLRKLD